MALVKGEVVIVQTSLIGSVLSNLLLVMGMCFFFGGLRRQEQYFNMTVAQTAASLLALAIASIIIPTVFDKMTDLPVASTAALSRGTSVILLVVYAGYLYFQLKTHSSIFAEESQKVPMRPSKRALDPNAIKKGMVGPAGLMGLPGVNEEGASNNIKLQQMLNAMPTVDEDDEEGEDPQLSFTVAVITLVGSTVLIAFCAEFLVDSIQYVTASGGISKEFLGLILLPIVGNAAEHATAVTVACKDKMDLAIGVAVGSSMQVSLFLIPLLVVIGWGMGVDAMNLSFDLFQVAVLFVSVLLVNYLIGDGKSHWLEGMLLMCLYVIIAVCSWCKYPQPDPACMAATNTITQGTLPMTPYERLSDAFVRLLSYRIIVFMYITCICDTRRKDRNRHHSRRHSVRLSGVETQKKRREIPSITNGYSNIERIERLFTTTGSMCKLRSVAALYRNEGRYLHEIRHMISSLGHHAILFLFFLLFESVLWCERTPTTVPLELLFETYFCC